MNFMPICSNFPKSHFDQFPSTLKYKRTPSPHQRTEMFAKLFVDQFTKPYLIAHAFLVGQFFVFFLA